MLNMTTGAKEWYKCESSGINGTNCTADEIAALQWGKSGITKFNGLGEVSLPTEIEDNPYTPSSETTASWGNYPVFGVMHPPEFYYYSHEPYFYSTAPSRYELNLEQVIAIMDPNGAWYGLSDVYNAIHLIYAAMNPTKDTNDYLGQVADAYGVDREFMSDYMSIMQYHVSEYLLEGIVANYTARDLILGFDTHIAEKINHGEQLRGSFHISSKITPALNTIYGAYAEQVWKVNAGCSDTECTKMGLSSNPIGRINEIGNYTRSEEFYTMYNGVEFNTVAWPSSH